MLQGKTIVLGVSGGIAVYKAVELLRLLTKAGAEVHVVMTRSAREFVTPLTFQTLSGHPVHTDLFSLSQEQEIGHISLADRANLFILAPATANLVGKIAQGIADDLLTTSVMATQAPVLVVPAMNSNMYLHPATQANLQRLTGYGYHLVEPACGRMACDAQGPGRLPEWPVVREAVLTVLASRDLAGRRVLVTAGPTHEPLDPVRYLGNRSSGRMGFALAATARRRGAEVIMISGPSSLPDPPGVTIIRVNSATEMASEVLARAETCDAVVKAAAVSDFRPSHFSTTKIKKAEGGLTLELTANLDILKTLGERKADCASPPILVGFAAETGELLDEGRRKLHDKNLDLLAFNDVSADDAGFAVETNRIIILDRDGGEEQLPLLDKEQAADRIWNRVVKLLDE